MARNKLTFYSPGQSPFDFYWQAPDNTRISGRKVLPSEIAALLERKGNEHYRKADYRIHKIEGEWTMMKEVVRTGENTLAMFDPDENKMKEYRYRFLRDCPADRELWFAGVRFEFWMPEAKQFWELRNWSMKLQMTLFLRYETIWEQTRYVKGKRIPDKMTWRPKVLFKESHFPDGDGKSFS